MEAITDAAIQTLLAVAYAAVVFVFGYALGRWRK